MALAISELALKFNHAEKGAGSVYVLAAGASWCIYHAGCSTKIIFHLMAGFTAAETCIGGELGHFQDKQECSSGIMHHPEYSPSMGVVIDHSLHICWRAA